MSGQLFWTQAMLDALRSDCAAGVSAEASGRHIGVCRESVRQKRRELNLTPTPKPPVVRDKHEGWRKEYRRIKADPVRYAARQATRRLADARRAAIPGFKEQKNARDRERRALKSATRHDVSAPEAGASASMTSPPKLPGRLKTGRVFLAGVFVCMNLYHPAKLLCGGPYSEREAQRQLQDAYHEYTWDSDLAGDGSTPFFVRPGDQQYNAAKESLDTP